jgi:hypothetical protein
MLPSGWPAAGLALAVVLAGCTAVGLGTESPTPIPTPAWPAEGPPGVTTDGVADPLALARAHTGALVGRSFTYRATVVVRTTGGIQLGTVHTVRRVGADGRFAHRMRTEGVVPSAVTPFEAVDVYSNGTRTVIRFRRDGENRTLVSSARSASIAPYDVVGKGTLYSVLSATDPRALEPIRRGGTTYVHLRGENGTTTLGVTRVTNATFEALVAPSGLVSRYRLTYHADESGYADWAGRLDRTVVYEAVGETRVERPGWLPGAAANATAVPPGR